MEEMTWHPGLAVCENSITPWTIVSVLTKFSDTNITLSIALSLSKNRPVYFSKHKVSETGPEMGTICIDWVQLSRCFTWSRRPNPVSGYSDRLRDERPGFDSWREQEIYLFLQSVQRTSLHSRSHSMTDLWFTFILLRKTRRKHIFLYCCITSRCIATEVLVAGMCLATCCLVMGMARTTWRTLLAKFYCWKLVFLALPRNESTSYNILLLLCLYVS
jgi:hypothetical protein